MLLRLLGLVAVVSISVGCAVQQAADKGFGADASITKYDSFLGLNDLNCGSLSGESVAISVRNSLESSYVGELMNPNTGVPTPYNYEGDIAADVKDRVSQILSESCGAQIVDQAGDISVEIDLKRAAFQVLNYVKNGDDPSQICIVTCELIWDYTLRFGTVLESDITVARGDLQEKTKYEHNVIWTNEVAGKGNFVSYLGWNMNMTSKWIADFDDLYTIASMSVSKQLPRMGGLQASGSARLYDIRTGNFRQEIRVTKDSYNKAIKPFGSPLDREFGDSQLFAIERLFGSPEGNLRLLIADMSKHVVENSEKIVTNKN